MTSSDLRMKLRSDKQTRAVDDLRAFINSHINSIAMEPAESIGPYDAMKHKPGDNCAHCRAHKDLDTILQNCADAHQELHESHVKIVTEYVEQNKELNAALEATNQRLSALQRYRAHTEGFE
jgi:hypothetical protein